MSALGDLLRAELNLNAKYKLKIVDGDSPPKAHHEDGWTKWKNGRPRSYTRAVNELRVGRQWLNQHFPATYMTEKLTGTFQLQSQDVDARNEQVKMERWVRERTQNQCWTVPERSRSLDSEEDERMYA